MSDELRRKARATAAMYLFAAVQRGLGDDIPDRFDLTELYDAEDEDIDMAYQWADALLIALDRPFDQKDVARELIDRENAPTSEEAP